MAHQFLCIALLFLSGCGGMPSSVQLEAAEDEYTEGRNNDTIPPGQCETPENLEILRPDNHNFAERWAEHSGLGGLNTPALHAEYPSMSLACLNCFGAMTKCAVSNCGLGMCDPIFGWGQRHLKCRECTKNACGADMIRCSGLLPDQWPDFYRGQST